MEYLGISGITEAEEFRSALEQQVRAEARYGWDHTRILYMGFTRAGQRLIVLRTAAL